MFNLGGVCGLVCLRFTKMENGIKEHTKQKQLYNNKKSISPNQIVKLPTPEGISPTSKSISCYAMQEDRDMLTLVSYTQKELFEMR